MSSSILDKIDDVRMSCCYVTYVIIYFRCVSVEAHMVNGGIAVEDAI